MSTWTVEVNWICEVEADDEGDALIQADMKFSLMREARAHEECTCEHDLVDECGICRNCGADCREF